MRVQTLKKNSSLVTILEHGVVFALLAFMLVGCRYTPQREVTEKPQRLRTAHFVAPDGAVIPVRTRMPSEAPKALVIAVHGFNDYSRAFETVAPRLGRAGIGMIAYDQRGFGMSAGTGTWAGLEHYATDLRSLTFSVQVKYPGVPIYLLGESMGAAVVISALSRHGDLPVTGVILSAPAVWSRETMPWYQLWVLESAAALFPEMRVTGSGLKVQASDNVEMLHELGRDPWVIKASRVDAIHGLADLMDIAQTEVARIPVPILVLYGGQDQIIPEVPVHQMVERLSGRGDVRLAFYPKGYHLLLRDLHAEIALGDIIAWISKPLAPLPSGCEVGSGGWLTGSGPFSVSPKCLSDRSGDPQASRDPR